MEMIIANVLKSILVDFDCFIKSEMKRSLLFSSKIPQIRTQKYYEKQSKINNNAPKSHHKRIGTVRSICVSVLTTHRK